MEKTINIDGKEVRLRATAAVPRLYRIKFGRDIMQDLAKLAAAYEKATTEQEQLAATDLGLFKALPTSWQSTRTRTPYPAAWRNGWNSLRFSTFTKFCRRSLNCGT